MSNEHGVLSQNDYALTLLNKNNEPINNQEVDISIKRDNGDSYPFHFSKTNGGYKLNAGLLPTGNYSFSAKTSGGNKHSGNFRVVPLQAEFNDLRANHELLKELSNVNNGSMFEVSITEKDFYTF